MRITMKGGVWKNSEDEILKAAVMKYGINNWSRVASLLVRKSARQCKARWYEWLDPSVKKTEWTREEEEKLLHLAKVFPAQWRTIAPLVGRTAHQCLEHYEKLLDQAAGRDPDDPNDPRRLRPGEIDPHPETKPSRADAVDMDDDEKEMLAEARARLANTRGKKAKRKAREKQLEEARRLAALQKRRELKAAGIAVSAYRPRIKGVDYANEVPFEQVPASGFHEVGPDENPEFSMNFKNVSLQQLEGKRRVEETKRMRKDDTRKLKRLQEENLPAAMQVIDDMNYALQHRKRSKFELPLPELTERDLENILDMGKQQTGVATSLLTSTGGTPVMTPVELSHRLQSGLTPMPQTPSIMTPIMNGSAGGGEGAALQLAPEVQRQMAAATAVSSLNALPASKNVVEVAMPLPVTEDGAMPVVTAEVEMEPDMEDVLQQAENERRRQKEIAFKKQTKVTQQKLPRPLFPDTISIGLTNPDPNSELSAAEVMLNKEIQALVLQDAVKFPVGKGIVPPSTVPPAIDFDLEELEESAAVLQEEDRRLQKRYPPPDSADLNKIFQRAYGQFVYNPHARRWDMATSDVLLVEALRSTFDDLKANVTRDLRRVDKMEKKLDTLTKGYRLRIDKHKQDFLNAWDEHQRIRYDLEAFNKLSEAEDRAIAKRRMEVQRLVEDEKARHAALQRQYQEAMDYRDELLNKLMSPVVV